MTASGFVGILDLKKDAVVGLDGQNIVLQTDDFVGVNQLDQDSLHLITVRSQQSATVTVGFLVHDHQLPLVRRFDPQTEEVSSQPVDTATVQNLLQQVSQQTLPPSRVVAYSKIVSDSHSQRWKEQTRFIQSSRILEIRGIASGDKIVPGAFQEDDEMPSATSPQHEIIDGKSVVYPSIPVVDANLSLHTNRHPGTKRYLSHLTPSDRTQLFMEPRLASRLLNDVLSKYYQSNWENLLGDLQLAYVMFLYMQCLSSLEHWKDLVAMLSLVDPVGMQPNAELYRSLLTALPSQILTMESNFLEDVDEAGNNFLLSSLRQLRQNLSRAEICPDEELSQFQRILANKFPTTLVFQDDSTERLYSTLYHGNEEEEDDGPVVVDMEDIRASIARSSDVGNPVDSVPAEVRQSFPVLVAAIMPHEDIVMTAARALDEKRDVSLVREAAAYLEEREQTRME